MHLTKWQARMPNILPPRRMQQQLLQEKPTHPRQTKLGQIQTTARIQNEGNEMGEQTKFRLRGDDDEAAFPRAHKQSRPPGTETKITQQSTQYNLNRQFRKRKRELQKQLPTKPLTIKRSIPTGLRTNPDEGESNNDRNKRRRLDPDDKEHPPRVKPTPFKPGE